MAGLSPALLSQVAKLAHGLAPAEPDVAGRALSPNTEFVPWKTPESWLGSKVQVEYALPMQGKDGSLSFPGFDGELVADTGGGIVVRMKRAGCWSS